LFFTFFPRKRKKMASQNPFRIGTVSLENSELEHTGQAAQVPIPITHNVPMYDGRDWTRRIPLDTFCLFKNVTDKPISGSDRTVITSQDATHAAPSNMQTYVLPVPHVNSVMVDQFNRMCNKMEREGKNLQTDLDFEQVLKDLFSEWRPAGPRHTDTGDPEGSMFIKKFRGAKGAIHYVQGQFPTNNLWGNNLRGGLHASLLLKYTQVQSSGPTFSLSSTEHAQPTMYEGDAIGFYPSWFAVIHEELTIPQHLKQYKIRFMDGEERVYEGLEQYIGMCMHNPDYKRTRETAIRERHINSMVGAECINPVDMLYSCFF
jgi:hypothetical protein